MAKKRKPLPEVDPEPPSEVEDDETSEDEEELPTMDSIRSLLEPFDKNQLIEILKNAALKDPSLLSRITDSAESEPGHRKIFVHGLGREVTSESLADAFATYGEIESCNIVSDKATGRSKGYGFVTFATRRGAMKALKEPQKRIGGRSAMCQLASAGPSGPAKVAAAELPPDDLALTYAAGLMGRSAGPTAVVGRGIAGAPLSYYAAAAVESGINSISPSVIGSYGSQAALQGLGAYQASQLGSDSAAAAARIGGYPSYLRH